MKAELKSLFNPFCDLTDWQPRDPDCFELEVTAFIGRVGGDSSDAFDFRACTPSWFAESYELSESAIELQHGLIVMRYWDYGALERLVRRICADAEGPNWGVVASKLSRYFDWEYAYALDKEWALGRPYPPDASDDSSGEPILLPPVANPDHSGH